MQALLLYGIKTVNVYLVCNLIYIVCSTRQITNLLYQFRRNRFSYMVVHCCLMAILADGQSCF